MSREIDNGAGDFRSGRRANGQRRSLVARCSRNAESFGHAGREDRDTVDMIRAENRAEHMLSAFLGCDVAGPRAHDAASNVFDVTRRCGWRGNHLAQSDVGGVHLRDTIQSVYDVVDTNRRGHEFGEFTRRETGVYYPCTLTFRLIHPQRPYMYQRKCMISFECSEKPVISGTLTRSDHSIFRG